MLKKIMIVCLALSLSVPCYALPEVESTAEVTNADAVFNPITGFRGYEWGTSYDDLFKAETEGLEQDKDYFIYENINDVDFYSISKFDTVCGFNGYYYYLFDKDKKLHGGAYIIYTNTFSYAELYNNYVTVVKAYETKYGTGETESIDWVSGNSSFYENTAYGLGSAIYIGELILENRWNGNDTSTMRTKIEKIQSNVVFSIYYTSPKRAAAITGSTPVVVDDDI